MSRTKRIIALFRERFIQRKDCYPQQLPDGAYTVIHEPLTDSIIHQHLRGDLTVGLYPSLGNSSKWLCIDIDTTVATATQVIQEQLNSLGVPFLTEFSGRKGFHIWVFFSRPVPNQLVRRFGQTITSGHEIFPKQDQVSPDAYGNLVKAPLGKHQVSGRWCLFVNEDLNVLDDPYGVLEAAPTIDLTQRLSMDDFPDPVQFQEVKAGNSGSDTRANTSILRPPLIKDCIQDALRTGCDKGKRNITAHILATELRNAGVPLEQSAHLIRSVWNPRNRPPLSGKEIERVVCSAYHQMPLQYGCHPDGRLRQVIQCLGSEQCVFYTLLRSTNPRKEVIT